MSDITPETQKLFDAVHANNIPGAEEALNANADINGRDDRGDTPIMSATRYDYVEMVQKLIERGADLRKGDRFGNDPLTMAAAGGKNDVCVVLINAGCDVNQHMCRGDTPLHMAARYDRDDTCLKLIELGADMEATNAEGDTPLTVAAKGNRSVSAQALLCIGAKIYEHFNIDSWLEGMGKSAKEHFFPNKPPTDIDCFPRDEQIGLGVLFACVTDQFGPLVAEPLLAAKEYDLFKKVWDALPEYWRDQNQGFYVEYTKKKLEITPAPFHTLHEGRVPL